MEGSITKRKDGRWQGAVDIPTLTDKRKRKFVYASTRAECRKKINELIEEIENDGVINPTKATFREYAQMYLDTYCVNLSPTTIEGYKKSITKYADSYIGNTLLKKILPIHIQEMINEFAKTHSEKTCKNLIGDISGVFKYAILNKVLKTNPCVGVKVPKDTEPYKYYIYNEEEFNRLLVYVTGTKEEIPILLGALCGLRMSEVMGLTWNDINFDTNEIHVRRAYVHVGAEVMQKKTKTKTSYRSFQAPQYVIERLELYKGVGFVYPKKDGTAENGGNYGIRFSKILKNAGLPHTRFHDLRHFNATMMLKNGVSDKEAAERLGHSDINMTKRYQHILSNMKSNAANVLNNIVKASDVKKDVK
ncbi:MAG: site-specific integrase [Endomicrobiaceae bacterium]|nr:site-specific integrase [Endomicrobiaceae bacterium]